MGAGNNARCAVFSAQIIDSPDGIHQMHFRKIRTRLFPVRMQRLMAAVEQRFPRVQAGDFKISLKNMPTGGENQRMGPDLFPNRAFVNQVGDAGCRRFLVVLHCQIIALSLDDGVDKRAHRRQPLRVRHVMHDGIAQGIKLLFHCRAQRNVRPQRIQINRRLLFHIYIP